MTPCDCPLAGYCERHQRMKTGRIYDLCKNDVRYFDIWERQVNEQAIPHDTAKVERHKRAKESRERTERLISWLTLFRLPDESGIGDTAHRLNKLSCKSPDAGALIKRLLTMCSCSRADAVARLNAEHPYPANTRSLGGS